MLGLCTQYQVISSKGSDNLTISKIANCIAAMRGLSQAELAHRAGISPVSVSTFESGHSDMRASTVIKLCIALSVTIVYRMDGTEITGP